MRIQDIRQRRQQLQAQLFTMLETRSSVGANIVGELSCLADEEDEILDHSHLFTSIPTNSADGKAAATSEERQSLWIALQQLKHSLQLGS